MASHTTTSRIVEAAHKPSTTGFTSLRSTETLIRIFLEIFGEDVLILPTQVFLFLDASLFFEDLMNVTSFPFEDLMYTTYFPLAGDTSFFEGDTGLAVTISLDRHSKGITFQCVTQVLVSTHHPTKPKTSLF